MDADEKRLKRNAYMREWNARNRERISTQRKARETPAIAEANRQRARAWYRANEERAKEREKQRYHANKTLTGYAVGERNGTWKGDEAGYHALHKWIARVMGKADHCEQCGATSGKRFEWANLTGRYLRDVTDWRQLCHRCHYHYDVAEGLRRPIDPMLGVAARRK